MSDPQKSEPNRLGTAICLSREEEADARRRRDAGREEPLDPPRAGMVELEQSSNAQRFRGVCIGTR